MAFRQPPRRRIPGLRWGILARGALLGARHALHAAGRMGSGLVGLVARGRGRTEENPLARSCSGGVGNLDPGGRGNTRVPIVRGGHQQDSRKYLRCSYRTSHLGCHDLY